MTQEEKAKAYDKAIEKMKSKLKDFKEIIISRSDIEEIFPNLQESEDERIRKGIIDLLRHAANCMSADEFNERIAWLEKQGQSKKTSIWKHWKDGIAGNGDGIPVFLIKNGFTYSLSSCLGFECDYIELSELDNLMLEQQENSMEINPSEFDLRLNRLLKQFKSLPKEELKSSLSFYLNVIQNDGTYKEEKQGEQKSAEKKELNKIHVIDEGKDEMDSCFTKMMNGEKVSPSWSEEDEEQLNCIIKEIESELKKPYFEGYDLICNKKISWLKSLKQRLLS